ncbi:YqzK family protein [Pseudalkalibacillus berkeleyi]|uniref:YqzK family protein n=1 Tax=Pseudalkalibacillus berkeleyi TaxID=1069813 RepID=A0ABS9H1F1_9BACL|nr:YqzK family protein [Pseudalkalibacillus berkeleyi]MCF6137658.1 YqzK family protein [Pseudalkalibacillus berkeleyi]
MISFIRLLFNTTKVFLAFIFCTLLFYYGLLWLNEEYQDFHRYDEPEGRAVKVFEAYHEKEYINWVDRLQLFYDTGE